MDELYDEAVSSYMICSSLTLYSEVADETLRRSVGLLVFWRVLRVSVCFHSRTAQSSRNRATGNAKGVGTSVTFNIIVHNSLRSLLYALYLFSLPASPTLQDS